MPKLKPKWVKTDIPKDIKVKLWRIMKDNPTFATYQGQVSKHYDEIFEVSEKDKYAAISNDTYKALKYEIVHMPVEEVENLPPDLQSWVRQLRPELELERYPRREAEDYSAITNVDAIVSMPELERRHKTWILHEWLGLDEGKIAGKLYIPPKDVQHDIEETGKELTSKTKEETKMEQSQSMVNLPPWVNQAQREHLEGREQRDELGGGIDIITYPGGIGIRQQLGLFQGCFSDINPRNRSFWHLLDEDVMTQLRGHLPDKAFWSQVKDFSEKAGQCEALLDVAYGRFTSVGEELAPLELSPSPTSGAYVTAVWARAAAFRALGPPLGFKHLPSYDPRVSPDAPSNSWLSCDGLIYMGPDLAAAEQRHRQVVDNFSGTEEFSLLVSMMKELRDLRQQIIARIGECLRRREYSFNYCPDCPAEQARKMLTSKGN